MTARHLFFGVSSGRTGTMMIANALNAEPEVTCLHEGKFRHLEASGDSVLPYLTLENRLAYENPAVARDLFAQQRGRLEAWPVRFGRPWFGDIAYYYAPFLGAIRDAYPDASLVVLFRHPVAFMASAAAVHGPDPAPLGWPPDGRELTPVERFVGLGRLQPRAGSPEATAWPRWSYLVRNAWLWAETNRMILDFLDSGPTPRRFVRRFEDFFADPVTSYGHLREFLGLPGQLPQPVARLFERPVNRRPRPAANVLEQLTAEERETVHGLLAPVMIRLEYPWGFP